MTEPREDRPSWGAGAWTAWSFAVVAHFIAALFAIFLIIFGASSTCRTDATVANLSAGLRDLAIAAAVLAVGWVAAALFTRRRWGIMLTGWLVGISPLLVAAATHTRTQDWVGAFCF